MKRLFTLIMAALFIAGCSCPESVVRYKEIPIIPPALHDTVWAQRLDTLILGEKIIQKDTVLQIKYYPRAGYFDFTAIPDTVWYTDIDTLTITKTETITEEYSTTKKMLLSLAGYIIGLIMMAFILRRKN